MSKNNSSFWKRMSRGTRFQIGFYLSVLIIGIGALVGPYLSILPEFKNLLTNFGAALIAASILGFAQRLFFFDDFESEMDGLVSNSLHSFLSTNMFPFLKQGFEGLFENRRVGMNKFIDYIEKEDEKLIIIGSSLKGILDPTENNKFRREFAELIQKKYGEIQIKFLLTHPAVAFLREKAEGRTKGDIKKEILRTLQYLTGHDFGNQDIVNPLGIKYEDIRLYHGTPTIFSVITSERILLNPYTYQANAFENFSFEIVNKGDQSLYTRIIRAHFERPWNNYNTVTVLSESNISEVKRTTLLELYPDREEFIMGNSKNHQEEDTILKKEKNRTENKK